MSEGLFTSLRKNYTTKEAFDAEAVREDFEFDIANYDDSYDVVFENDNYKICHPTAPEGLIPLAADTRWLAGSSSWNTNRKSGWDEIDTEYQYGPWANYSSYYIILDKQDPKKKWMFKRGYGDIYAPSYARYPCATWVANNGDEAMWRWFLDQKFPYITTNLDKKIGSKLIQDKTTFIYPDDADKLSWYAKKGSSITKIEFAKGVTKIKSRAFSGLQSIREVVIPEGVKSIGSYAFYNTGIEKVTLPSTLTTIGNDAFGYCRGLKEINLPDSITKMGDAVLYATALTKMPEWPKGLNYIPDSCFSSCVDLEHVVIPNHIETIGGSAFSNCLIRTVIIPDSVKSIGSYAFNFKEVKYIYIPKSVEKIDSYAFGSMGWYHRGDAPEVDIVIDCAFEENEIPSGWHKNWNAYDAEERPGRSYVDPDRWIYKKLHINWGIPAPRRSLNEDLEFSEGTDIPGKLTDEQCDKLLDILTELPNLAENNKDEWKRIHNDWLLNIWMSNDIPNDYKLKSYAETLSNPNYTHIATFWAHDNSKNRNNYIISRFNTEELDKYVDGEFDKYFGTSSRGDICVSEQFLKEYLGMTPPEINEDFDFDFSDDVTGKPVYEDSHWIIFNPKTDDEFMVLSDGTKWGGYENVNPNGEQYRDWRFSYYQQSPLYIFENKDSGERFLYNTRDSYSPLRTENNKQWSSSESPKRYIGSNRTQGNILGLFLLEAPNAEGLIKWCMRKWPQGLAELKIIVKGKEELAEANNVVMYKSELYEKLHNASPWYWYNEPDRKQAYIMKEQLVTQIGFPRNTQKIEAEAFKDFKAIKTVVLPNTIREIGNNAFQNCEQLSTINLPSRLQSIGEYAFVSCRALNNIVIPASCTHLGKDIFKYCRNLETIYCEAPRKPEGWDENWDVSGERNINVPGAGYRTEQIKHNVVWNYRKN